MDSVSIALICVAALLATALLAVLAHRAATVGSQLSLRMIVSF